MFRAITRRVRKLRFRGRSLWLVARAHPAERSHYVVISRDRRQLVARVRVMLP